MAISTVPPGTPQGSPASYIVYNTTVGSASATSIAATNLFSPPANAIYRVSVFGVCTVAGTGTGTGASTVALTLTWQDPLGSGTVTSAFCTLSFGAAGDNYNSAVGNEGSPTTGSRSTVVNATAGVAVQLTTTYTKNGALTTGPTVQVYAVVESLG